jgi:hypothetical protein
MQRIPRLVSILVLLGALAAPSLQAQGPADAGKSQGQQLRKRDGSCGRPGQGRRGCRGEGCRGVRKQDGTGPRAGTPDCPRTRKAPAK